MVRRGGALPLPRATARVAPTEGLQEAWEKNPPATASPCQSPLGKGPKGRGMRIATASLRTGLAMTGFQEVRWVSLWCVGEGLSCPPLCRPTDGHCRARQSGHFLETGSLHPPLAALRRFPLPRATARVAPTEGYKRCGEVKNPPVTASPRQSPLGKGTEGTGETDCHGRCAHRPRKDTFSRSAVGFFVVRRGGALLPTVVPTD